MNKWITGILIVFVILWIYYLQYYKITTNEKIFTDDLISSGFLKTGDLILFKAYNNFNSIFHGSYFGHIGMVFINKDGIPMLFEANGIERVPLLDHHSRHGIFLTPLADRIKKYKGRCFWKPLNHSIDKEIIDGFCEFIDYCLDSFIYDYAVVSGGIDRGLGLKKCGKGTDCGQIIFLSLIKLGLIPIEEYDVCRFHHLKYVCNIAELMDDYKYLELIEIIEHPFAY